RDATVATCAGSEPVAGVGCAVISTAFEACFAAESDWPDAAFFSARVSLWASVAAGAVPEIAFGVIAVWADGTNAVWVPGEREASGALTLVVEDRFVSAVCKIGCASGFLPERIKGGRAGGDGFGAGTAARLGPTFAICGSGGN